MKLKLCSRCLTKKSIDKFYEKRKNKQTFKIRLRCSNCRNNALNLPKKLFVVFD